MTNYFICITGERYTSTFDEQVLSDICKLVASDKVKSVEFVFGDCTGVDAAALRACKLLSIKHKVYIANWTNLGKIAGPTRNKQMIDYLVSKRDLHNATIQVWAYHTDYKKSKGTVNTIKLADKAGIYVVKN